MAVTLTIPAMTLNKAQGSVTATDDAITMARTNGQGVACQVTGTWTGTITFEATVEGSTWVAFNMTPSNSGTDASTTTGNGTWSKRNDGYTAFRGRFSTATSGTPTITWRSVNAK